MSGHDDMSGFWTGEYRYSDSPLVVRFTAAITERSGHLTGSTLEPNPFMGHGASEAEAVIDGTRAGQAVQFTKVYRAPPDRPQPPLLYEGTVNPDFTFVTGTWRFVVRTSVTGAFTMSRVASGARHAVVRYSEHLPAVSGG